MWEWVKRITPLTEEVLGTEGRGGSEGQSHKGRRGKEVVDWGGGLRGP